MARRKRQETEATSSWLDTYADMVTLLLTFFVLLYASSTLDETKYQMIRQAFQNWGQFYNVIVDESQQTDESQGSLPEDTTNDLPIDGVPQNFDQLYQYLVNYLEENNLQDSVELDRGATHIYMRFRDNVFFDGDSAILLGEGKTVLEGIAPGIGAVEDKILRLIVTGHTANVPTSPINDWDLSMNRAFSVNDYIEDLAILPSSKQEIRAYGRHRPIADNDTEEGRSLNRRVELILLRNDVDWTDPDVIADFYQLELGTDVFDPDAFMSDDEIDEDTDNNS